MDTQFFGDFLEFNQMISKNLFVSILSHCKYCKEKKIRKRQIYYLKLKQLYFYKHRNLLEIES